MTSATSSTGPRRQPAPCLSHPISCSCCVSIWMTSALLQMGACFAAGGTASSVSVYGRIWQQARQKTLTAAQQTSPLAARPYDLRHSGITLALNAGIPAPEVARRAGHSVAVLLRVYAGCLDGHEQLWNSRLDQVLNDQDSL